MVDILLKRSSRDLTTRVSKCLDVLKKRLQGDFLLVQQEEGILEKKSFVFHKPASVKEIDDFFNNRNWHIPEDYKEFLTYHNGALLFGGEYYDGGMDILSLEKIDNFLIEYDYLLPSHCYPIGYYHSAIIFIDSEICKKSNEYLYWQTCIDKYDRALELRMNFETWLDLFIVAQGTEYWLWPTFKHE